MKKIGTVTLNIIYTVVVLGVLAIALLFIGTKIDILGYEVKIVQSGSMEPAIKTGGIVIIAPSSVYNVGDVITFGRDTKREVPVTHRVVEKIGEGNRATYVTKGDANEDRDPNITSARSIIGKVAFSIPYAGYVIEFARTPTGFLTLIGIPALVIVLDEFANIVWEVRVYLAKKRRAAGRKTSVVAGGSKEKEKATMNVANKRLVQRNQHAARNFDLQVKPYQRV